MPRLLRGIARTAVVAGTATVVSNNVSRRQAARQAARNPEPEPEPMDSGMDTDSQISQIQQLGELHSQGLLTDGEFQAKKQQILGV
jgi:hypothetical protein